MSHHFLLVGNNPYTNRGCEAIVRGTMRILRSAFGEDTRATVATFDPRGEFGCQAGCERDPGISHIRLPITRRFSPGWWLRQVDKALGSRSSLSRRALCSAIDASSAVVQIGGDNYTLDYGYPRAFMEIDRLVLARKKPLVLWGASVGPFDADPAFRDEIAAHLREFDAIAVREPRSEDILRQMGLAKNVFRMTDPAFVMEPLEPGQGKLGFCVPDGAIGLNLSPLLAKYVTGGDLTKWRSLGAEIVGALIRALERPVVLVPHVTSPDPMVDDGLLLQQIGASLPEPESRNVRVVGTDLTAAETKWLISKCCVFAGARTHSTIAAISSGVPTLCFAYSTKARGLSEAVYGSSDYCVEPGDLTPERVVDRMTGMLSEADAIRTRLRGALPALSEGCFAAGSIVKKVISGQPDG